MTTPAVTANHIERFYGSFKALDNVSFSVPRGSIFGFLGPNGAGKTTTLYILTGLLKSHGGEVFVLGLDPQKDGDKLRGLIGCLLEDSGLYDELTVFENLSFFGKAQGLDDKTIEHRIDENLEFFSLLDSKSKRAGQLSSGMRQKTALARAMLAKPQILFLDEPTANLDPGASVQFRELLLELAKKDGTTVFLNTHRLEEAEKVCDHVAVIQKGRIVTSGSIESLKSGGQKTVRITGANLPQDISSITALSHKVTNSEITVDIGSKEDVPGVVKGLCDGGASIYSVVLSDPSLEDIFLSLTNSDKR